MTVHLPEDLERYVRNAVQSGRFASEDEAIAAAVRLLRQHTVVAAPQRKLTEHEWQRRLVEVGLMSNIPPARGAGAARADFQPVQIKGEPLSETILRERR